MMGILDPSITRPEQHFTYSPRPQMLKRLRIGLIEYTKKNAEAMLCKVAERLEAALGMKLQVLVHKPQRAPLLDSHAMDTPQDLMLVCAGSSIGALSMVLPGFSMEKSAGRSATIRV